MSLQPGCVNVDYNNPIRSEEAGLNKTMTHVYKLLNLSMQSLHWDI